MIKRTLYFGNPAYLKLQNGQLCIDLKDTNIKTVAIEDIGIVVLDNAQITITQGAVNAMLENNVAILWCDAKHLPNGLLLPYGANTILTENLRLQLECSEPIKKQAWKNTVQTKIRNQAAVLKIHGLDYQNLMFWANDVNSGDTRNVEAKAAYYYWQQLFEHLPSFNRGRFEEPPNNLLNYGYAILRAVIARSLNSTGLIGAIGIHHRNKYNPFCLADDIMEPYRPYVDLLVLELIQSLDEEQWELTKEVKAQLLAIPAIDVHLEDKIRPLMVATQSTTASLLRFFNSETKQLIYPDLWENPILKD